MIWARQVRACCVERSKHPGPQSGSRSQPGVTGALLGAGRGIVAGGPTATVQAASTVTIDNARTRGLLHARGPGQSTRPARSRIRTGSIMRRSFSRASRIRASRDRPDRASDQDGETARRRDGRIDPHEPEGLCVSWPPREIVMPRGRCPCERDSLWRRRTSRLRHVDHELLEIRLLGPGAREQVGATVVREVDDRRDAAERGQSAEGGLECVGKAERAVAPREK